jgi:hypothetical protein
VGGHGAGGGSPLLEPESPPEAGPEPLLEAEEQLGRPPVQSPMQVPSTVLVHSVLFEQSE